MMFDIVLLKFVVDLHEVICKQSLLFTHMLRSKTWPKTKPAKPVLEKQVQHFGNAYFEKYSICIYAKPVLERQV